MAFRKKKLPSDFKRYNLAERVVEALPAIGFKKPTTVQHQVIPLILQRRNVIVEAATGTGKTAAYGLPLLSRLDYSKGNTQVLVLVPSRELARQVEAALRPMTTHPKFRIGAIYGGQTMAQSEKILKSGHQILVAVPGRLKDILRQGKHDYFWRDIKYLVIDEADKLLELGFQDILDNLVSNVRNMVQVALFSATISEDVEGMIRERFYPLQTIRLSPKEALLNISFHYVMVDRGQKHRYLAGLIRARKIPQALIFCAKREEVLEVANFLRSAGQKAEAYHGHLDQVERAAVMKRFKSKQVDFLVATDLAARGLDVFALTAVINYSFTDELEVFLHRCGRTGRAGRKGSVYNLIASKKEEIISASFHEELGIGYTQFQAKPITKDQLGSVEDKVVKIHFNRGKRDKIGSGDVVGFLSAVAGLDGAEIGTIAVYDGYTVADVPESAFEFLKMVEKPKLKGKSVKVTKYSLADAKRKSAAVKKSQIGVRDKKEMAEMKAKREKRAQDKQIDPTKPTDEEKDNKSNEKSSRRSGKSGGRNSGNGGGRGGGRSSAGSKGKSGAKKSRKR